MKVGDQETVNQKRQTKGWMTTRLGDVLTLQRGFDLPNAERQSGSVPIVSSSGITGNHTEARVHAPGVATGRYGTLGEVFFLEQDFWPLNTTLYVKDFKGSDPQFIYYLLQSLDFQSFNDKSSVPGLNRNHLHEVSVTIPRDVSEQRAIAHILGTLDDKIELNRKMNGTLDEIARTLFTSWCVTFDPVRAKAQGRQPEGMDAETAALFPDRFVDSELGPIPEGWEVRSLDEAASFLNGLALQKFPPSEHGPNLPVIKIAQLRKGNVEGADSASMDVPEAFVVQDGDVLFSWSGSLEVVIWGGGTGALNQHLFKVTSEAFPRWFYYYWIHHHLPEFRSIAAGKATTMGHIQRRHLTNAKVLCPSPDLLGRLDAIFSPLIDLVSANLNEGRTLVEARDTLLPELLSGRIRVADAEQLVEAAV